MDNSDVHTYAWRWAKKSPRSRDISTRSDVQRSTSVLSATGERREASTCSRTYGKGEKRNERKLLAGWSCGSLRVEVHSYLGRWTTSPCNGSRFGRCPSLERRCRWGKRSARRTRIDSHPRPVRISFVSLEDRRAASHSLAWIEIEWAKMKSKHVSSNTISNYERQRIGFQRHSQLERDICTRCVFH